MLSTVGYRFPMSTALPDVAVQTLSSIKVRNVEMVQLNWSVGYAAQVHIHRDSQLQCIV
jgi:hypothetical protein